MKIKMVCGFNNISWSSFNLAPLTNEHQRAELGAGPSWSRCLSWGEWDKLWRAESSWAADSSCRHIMEMWGILPPAPLTSWFSGCYWKISTFRTVMAAPDTRYSARQFNFNQRMVLMILLYISRNGVGDKRINLACRSCCLGLKSYLEAACPNNHWMPYYQLFVAVLGLLLMMVAHWLVVFQAVPRWVCAAGDESCCSWSRWDYPCCCHEVRPAVVVRRLQFWHHCA